jgi:hypothetical protein
MERKWSFCWSVSMFTTSFFKKCVAKDVLLLYFYHRIKGQNFSKDSMDQKHMNHEKKSPGSAYCVDRLLQQK